MILNIGKKHLLNFFFLFVLILLGLKCTSTKRNAFAYKVKIYQVDSAKHLLTASHLISYNSYLFEFLLRTKENTVEYGNSDKIILSTNYDTLGVYLLKNQLNKFFQFDSFSISGKIIKSDSLTKKEFGVRLSGEKNYNTENATLEEPKKIIINGVECYSANVVSKYNKFDTVESRILLMKNENFTSFYKINNIVFTDKKFCIVGIYAQHKIRKEGFSEEISDLRQLSTSEIEICESMIKKTTVK
jgi:hypothetical protein